MERFPDAIPEGNPLSPSSNYPMRFDGYPNHYMPRPDPWHARKSSWSNAQSSTGGKGHARQKSLSDAFRTIRTRNASVSANVHEISDALKAPVSPRLIILCIIWYFASALTNTSSKSILNGFPKPATLTIIQFAFVAFFCMVLARLSTIFPVLKDNVPYLRHGIRKPNKEVLMSTLPLAAFQIGGHLLSSTATAKIPVSLVHTIKGLSPLFTVFAYRILFDIRYPIATYLSLIPLTVGVMLACAAEFHANIMGICYALLAALIFVTQNIFSKRLFNEAAIAESTGAQASRRLDKLNLLCYSSGLAFLTTFPIWFWSEGIGLLGDFFHDGTLDLSPHPLAFDHGRLALEFLFNGTFHFAQNILAFVLLSMVSPVTYSVASLIKRVFVIAISIIWFQNATTRIQGLGIALTFFGLYLYDRTKQGNKADRKAKMLDIKGDLKSDGVILPLYSRKTPSPAGGIVDDNYSFPVLSENSHAIISSSIQEDGRKKDDDRFHVSPEKANGSANAGRVIRTSNAVWSSPGTWQEGACGVKEMEVNHTGMGKGVLAS